MGINYQDQGPRIINNIYQVLLSPIESNRDEQLRKMRIHVLRLQYCTRTVTYLPTGSSVKFGERSQSLNLNWDLFYFVQG